MRFSFSRRAVMAAGSAMALTAGLTTYAFASGSSTGDLTVSANVSVNCTIAADGFLGFSATDLTKDTSSQQFMRIACTNGGQPLSVSFNTGSNAGAACDTQAGGTAPSPDTNRCLKSGSNYLSYNIYTDSNHTTMFGLTGSSTTSETSTGAFMVYGLIPSGQTAPAASDYADTLTATVNY